MTINITDIWGRIRKFLTPELGKRIAVCLFMAGLFYLECAITYFYRAGASSIGNPFIQGIWFYLLIFGVSFLPGGTASRIMFSFWLFISGFIAIAGSFLCIRFGLEIDCDCYFVLAASSPGETREFIDKFVTPSALAMALGITLATAGMIWLVWRTEYKRSWWNAAVSLLLMLPFIINGLRLAKSDELIKNFTRSNLARVASGYFIYRQQFAKLLAMEKKPQLPTGLRDVSGGRDLIGVLVIGESANVSHWGSYGYPRGTTPQIEKRRAECLLFDDVISSAAHTTRACYHILTDARRGVPGFARFTLIDAAKAMGFQVTLISNQRRWGKHDGPNGILTAHCDKRIYIGESGDHKDIYDGGIIPPMKREINAAPLGRKLIILHLMGSHNEFRERYPAGFGRFDGVSDGCNRNMREKHARELNEYDNSIAYTDQVLGKALELLEKEKRPAFMIYLSDHSELGEWSGHSEARSKASKLPDIYEVPCLLWTNDLYRKEFPELVSGAKRNLRLPIVSDQMFWAALSALRITYDGFPETVDFFSAECLPAKKRYTSNQPYRPSKAKLRCWRRTRQ